MSVLKYLRQVQLLSLRYTALLLFLLNGWMVLRQAMVYRQDSKHLRTIDNDYFQIGDGRWRDKPKIDSTCFEPFLNGSVILLMKEELHFRIEFFKSFYKLRHLKTGNAGLCENSQQLWQTGYKKGFSCGFQVILKQRLHIWFLPDTNM